MKSLYVVVALCISLSSLAWGQTERAAAKRPVPKSFESIAQESAKSLVEPGLEVEESSLETAEGDALAAEVREALATVEPLEQTALSDSAASAPEQKISAAEKDIPVLTQATKPAVQHETGIWRILSGVGAIALLLVGAVFLLRTKANKTSPQNKNTQIKILTQHYIGPKKSLAILQVAGESVLIGITDQNISMLKTLSLLDEEIPDAEPQKFDSRLGKAKGKGQKLKEDFQGIAVSQSTLIADDDHEFFEDESEQTDDDEFSMADLKSLVGKKIKKMRVM